MSREEKIVIFDASALKDMCELLGVAYDKDIIAFTKEGVLKKGIFSIIKLADRTPK